MVSGFMLSQNIVLFLPTPAQAPMYPLPHNLLYLLPKSHAPPLQGALMVSCPQQPSPSALMTAQDQIVSQL